MNRKMIGCLVLVVALMVAPVALAKEDFAKSFSISRVGPLLYQVPEELIVSQDAEFSSFLITWEPISDAYAYYIGVTQEVVDKKGQNYYRMVDGWIGNGSVTNGFGQAYDVSQVVFDSIELSGDATQVDIAPILNLFLAEGGYTLLGTYVIFMIVPQYGPPIRQFIELPVK